MIGASGRWVSRVFMPGSNYTGRWSWIDVSGKKGIVIHITLAYMISQESPAYAGETTSYKQQLRRMIQKGDKKINPKETVSAGFVSND